MLVSLPNGSWVDPVVVENIAVHHAETSILGKYYPHRVAVTSKYRFYHVLECVSIEEAKELAARLGEEINAALELSERKGNTEADEGL